VGRTDAVQFTLECAAEWRRLGALVTFEAGWETRGNGTRANYEGTNQHHTATPSSLTRPFPTRSMLISGRTGLPGPLCNEATPVGPGDRPHIHVIAAHPANHAGASGGKSTSPMPVTTLYNPRSRGNEIDYAGDRPMTPGQYRAALIHGRGVVNVLGRGVEYIKAHAETSATGKWDPGYAPGKTIDMVAFRRDAATLSASPVEPSPTVATQEDTMPVRIEPGESRRFPTWPGPSKFRLNIVTGSVEGQPVYGKQVFSPDKAVGLFYKMWEGPDEWTKFLGHGQNVQVELQPGCLFAEVENQGTGPIDVTFTGA